MFVKLFEKQTTQTEDRFVLHSEILFAFEVSYIKQGETRNRT